MVTRMPHPAEVFSGTLALLVPHMDDCVLGCGGTLALLPDMTRVHVIYATDGRAAPAPIWPWPDRVPEDLFPVRMAEGRAAMASLGVPPDQVHFLGLPEARLQHHQAALRSALVERLRQIGPDHVLLPFRYDRHADHIALNHVVTAVHSAGLLRARLIEYFVYYRWRLLPAGDVRRYVRPEHLFQVPIDAVAARKRAALECFTSQTTRYYPWQTRPNLTAWLLDDVSRTPEIFLRYDPAVPGAAIFTHATIWLRLAHRLEPFIKRQKDHAVAAWRRGFLRNDGRTA